MARQKKAYSLDTAVIAAVEREATLRGIAQSAYVNDILLKATNADDAKRLGRSLQRTELDDEKG